MKYRVESREDFDIIDNFLSLVRRDIDIRGFINSLDLKDADIQLKNDMVVVTGIFNGREQFQFSSIFDVNLIEYQEGVLRIFLHVGTETINTLVFHLVADYDERQEMLDDK